MGGKSFIRLIVFLVVMITLSFSGNAILTADFEAVQNSIYLDEYATYKLTIFNDDKIEHIVQVYTPDVRWYVELDPTITRIAPGSEVVLEMRLIPSVWAESGAQRVNVIVDSSSLGKNILLEVPVFVKSFDVGHREYNPSVEMRLDFPTEIDPRDEIELNIYFRNRNRLDIKEMGVLVKSEIFEEYKTVSLEPLAEGREIFRFKLNDLTEPQKGNLEVVISVANRTINRERIIYHIIPYSEFVVRKDTIDELFKRNIEVIITNEGNVKKQDYFRLETSFLKRFFTKTIPPADRISLRRDAHYEWQISLEPKQEIHITIVENYRPLIYVLLISIVVVMVYFIYRSPVILKKEAIVVGSSREGVSEVKVLLHVRNRSSELVERIIVTDVIPRIATLIHEPKIGTINPSKVLRNDKKGTIVKWELEALDPFEERIISYKFKSKVVIVGGLSLPVARIKFEMKNGKERTVRSNKSEVSISV